MHRQKNRVKKEAPRTTEEIHNIVFVKTAANKTNAALMLMLVVFFLVMMARSLEPDGPCINEHLLKSTINMKRNYIFCGANKLSSNEHCWDSRVAAHLLAKGPLHLLPIRIAVQLVDRGASPELVEERLHCVAHAT